MRRCKVDRHTRRTKRGKIQVRKHSRGLKNRGSYLRRQKEKVEKRLPHRTGTFLPKEIPAITDWEHNFYLRHAIEQAMDNKKKQMEESDEEGYNRGAYPSYTSKAEMRRMLESYSNSDLKGLLKRGHLKEYDDIIKEIIAKDEPR